MTEEVYHDPSAPIPELTAEQRKKEQAEIVKRSAAAHAELAAMKPTPTPDEIRIFRGVEEATPAAKAPAAKEEKVSEAKPAERGMYETRASRARKEHEG